MVKMRVFREPVPSPEEAKRGSLTRVALETVIFLFLEWMSTEMRLRIVYAPASSSASLR